MLDELNLLRGQGITLPCGIAINHPQIGQIADFGEERYLKFVFAFTAAPTDYRLMLHDLGLDCDVMDDFELFMLLCKSFTVEETSILFGDFDFTKFEIAQNDDKSLYLYHPDGVIIDKPLHYLMIEYIRKINLIKKRNDRAGNDFTKKYLLDDARMTAEAMKRNPKPFESQFVPLISSLVNNAGFKYDYGTVMSLPIYTFYDALRRIQKIDNYSHVMSGIYAGTVDSKKIPKEQLNWMGCL